jgi:hypothetical protein
VNRSPDTSAEHDCFAPGLICALALVSALGCSDSDTEPGSPVTATGEFSALTYNVAGLPEGITGSPNPLARMPLIGVLFNDYDLVLTQEDWETPEVNPLAPQRVYHELLAERAQHRYRSIAMPVPLGNDPTHWPANTDRPEILALLSDGLNEFSRIEFDPKTTVHVTWNECYGDFTVGAGDCLATKGFSVTTHTLAPGVEVDIYNLHGEAGRTEVDIPLLVDNFEQQLADFVSDPARAGRAVILAGDTNLHTDRSPDGDAWRTFLTRTGLSDVCDTVACGAEADQIDKFAYRNSSTLEIVPQSHVFEAQKFSYEGGDLSDHPPLNVRFRWAKR